MYRAVRQQQGLSQEGTTCVHVYVCVFSIKGWTSKPASFQSLVPVRTAQTKPMNRIPKVKVLKKY